MLDNTIRHYPGLDLARFGKNPYGENLFRIVFSDSRRYIVYGEWPDGSQHAEECQKYPQYPATWVLEKWKSAQDFAGCTRETWDWKYTILGPYPERGEYDLSYIFDGGVNGVDIIHANLDKLISWIQAGEQRSDWERFVAVRNAYDQQKASNRSLQYEIIHDSLSAHLDFPMSGPYASRGTKTAHPLNLSAEETGLPVGDNKFSIQKVQQP